MNQGRVIDHQVLKYKYRTYRQKYSRKVGPKGGGRVLDYINIIEEGEEEIFEYLIRVEISKGWTPQGDYYQQGGVYRQTMVKYQGFVTTKPPSYIKRRILRDEEGVPSGVTFEVEKYKGDQLISSEEFVNGQVKVRRTVTDGSLVKLDDDKYFYNEEKKKGEDGLWEWFHENGQIQFRRNYKNGEKDGLWEWFHENSQLQKRKNYKDGDRDGLWEWFHKNGQLKKRVDYKKSI